MRTNFRPIVLSLVSLAGCLIAIPISHAGPRAEFPPEDEAIVLEKWPEAITSPSGLMYVLVKEGTGRRPLHGERVRVLYRGTFLDGKEFSSTLDPENPFVFTVGTRKVIEAWEEAFAKMRVGEKRILIVPYALGYGLLGRPPDIPNRATLIFEVELLGIE